MSTKSKYARIGLIFIFITLVWICLFSYKDSDIIFSISLMFLFFGAAFFITYYLIGRVLHISAILNTIWALLLIGSFFLAQYLTDERDLFILENYRSNTTVATVVLKETYGRLFFRFKTDRGFIEHEVSNKRSDAIAGKQFLIRYSIEMPDIFVVIKQVE